MKDFLFNIRVYALILNHGREILLADEFQLNRKMTKFPGGGLKFGEGTLECLQREALEELGQKLEIIGHYYTTDFFQPALFFNNQQLISIYYKARLAGEQQFQSSARKHDYPEEKNGSISFRWMPVKQLKRESLSLPIDRIVSGKLSAEFRKDPSAGLWSSWDLQT